MFADNMSLDVPDLAGPISLAGQPVGVKVPSPRERRSVLLCGRFN
jgi:hypothetical protein